MTDQIELFIAEMEAKRSEVEDSYFTARPQADTLANRSLFRAAFERGFSRGREFTLSAVGKRGGNNE